MSDLLEQLLNKQQTWVPDRDDAERLRELLRTLDGPESYNTWLSWRELVARLEQASGAVFNHEHGLLLPKEAIGAHSLLARTQLKSELEAARAAVSKLTLATADSAAATAASASAPRPQPLRNGKGPAAAGLGQYRSLLATARADEYSLAPYVRQPPPPSTEDRSARLEAELLEATRQLERCQLDRKHAELERNRQQYSEKMSGSASDAAAAAAAAAAARDSSVGDRRTSAGGEERSVRAMTAREISDEVELRMQMKRLTLKRAEEENLAKAASQRQQLLARRRQPLPPQDSARVDAAMRGNKNEVLFTLFNATITREKFRCLQPLTWLNDEVINLYVQLLAKRDEDRCAADSTRLRSHFFSSFFLEKLDGQGGYNYAGVRRWTRKAKVDVFALDKIFVPVNISNMHWCMAVIYMRQKKVCYFDSMGGAGRRCCESLLRWLEDESEDKKGASGRISTDDWQAVPTPRDTPQQENGCDCGVFSITFCDYLSDDLPLAFSQDDMPAMRQRIAFSLMEGRYIE